MRRNELLGNDARGLARPNIPSKTPTQIGFSLVEVVIAMMLFGFLAIAILPLIVGVTQLTVANSESVSAKAAVQQKLAEIQRGYPTDPGAQVDPSLPVGVTLDCDALPLSSPLEESIGGGLTRHTVAGPCPASFPATVPLQITVTDQSDTVLASVHSSVRVTQ